MFKFRFLAHFPFPVKFIIGKIWDRPLANIRYLGKTGMYVWSARSKIPDRLGFSRHMKTRLNNKNYGLTNRNRERMIQLVQYKSTRRSKRYLRSSSQKHRKHKIGNNCALLGYNKITNIKKRRTFVIESKRKLMVY